MFAVVINTVAVAVIDVFFDVDIAKDEGKVLIIHVGELFDTAHDDFARGFVPADGVDRVV